MAFIGGLNEEKGSKIVADIIRKGSSDVEWYVMGGIGDAELAHLKSANLVKTGFYYQKDLYTQLKLYQIDVICILSKWPETFSYTLSEAIMSQIPVIVTDIGALGHRTRKNGCGVTVSHEGKIAVEQTLKQIKHWMDNPDELQIFQQRLEKYRHKDLLEMTEQYDALYYSAFEENNLDVSTDTTQKLYKAYMIGMCCYEDNAMQSTRISELENRLKMIDNSITFKIVMKLTKIKIPFKDKMRRILLRQQRG